MSEVQAPVTTEREVTIYATRSGQITKIMTAVQTWGDLKPLVRNAGYDLSSLLAAENINKSDLVNDLAVLPATAFRLFLRPAQTKSGATPDRKECFAIIKAHIAANPGDKAKFTIDGKNMTQLSTPVLQDLVARYCNGAIAPTVTEAPVKEKSLKTAAPKTEVVEAVKESKATSLTDAERVEQALASVEPLSHYNAYAKVEKHLNKLYNEIEEANAPVMEEESEEAALRREARAMGY